MTTRSSEARFSGINRLYGPSALEVFAAQNILVIGVGGVGSWVVEALARSGVGRLTLLDPDDISVSNANRQLHTLTDTIGLGKAEVLGQRVKGINPDCEVELIEDLLRTENIEQYLSGEFSFVIDAIDNATVKAALIAHCKRRKIPIVTVGGAGGQTDPTAIEVCDLSRTYNDPLLAKTRSLLRYRHYFTSNPKRRFTVPAIFSTEQLTYPQPDGEIGQQKPDTERALKMACDVGLGACTHVTATFGFVAVSVVLKKIMERHERSRSEQLRSELTD